MRSTRLLRFTRRSPRIRLLLGVVALPALLAGCSTQSASPHSPTAPATNSIAPATTDTSNSTSNAVAGGGQNATSTSTSNAVGTSPSSTTSSTSDTSNSTSPPPASTEPVHVILYNPTVESLDTVHVSGRVMGSSDLQRATVTAKYADTGNVVVSRQVPVSSDGQFNANLPISANIGPLPLTFKATYPGATSAAVTRYVTEIPVSGGDPVVMKDTRQTVVGMGADFPVYLPTWLPQTISPTIPSLPSYSTTVAAKSFNYNVQIFSTQKPFAVNSLAIEQTNDSELATVSGTQFQSAQAAQNQLMLHPNESLPNASTASRSVWLTGTLYATEYSDTWNSVVWHEGDWLLVVRGPSAQQNVNDAKKVAESLNLVYLPPTNGVVWIRNISDGSGPASPNTQVSFVENTNLYEISAQGQIYNPLVLASSMKP